MRARRHTYTQAHGHIHSWLHVCVQSLDGSFRAMATTLPSTTELLDEIPEADPTLLYEVCARACPCVRVCFYGAGCTPPKQHLQDSAHARGRERCVCLGLAARPRATPPRRCVREEGKVRTCARTHTHTHTHTQRGRQRECVFLDGLFCVCEVQACSSAAQGFAHASVCLPV